MSRVQLVFSCAAVLALGGCVKTDLNQPCTLVKSGPNGTAVPILEGELRNLQGADKDFISSGSVECEDQTCVRDARFVSDAGADKPAVGYCSKQCQIGTICPSYDSALDKGPNKLTCRALFLSAETLQALAGSDAGFTGVKDPNFCVRGM